MDISYPNFSALEAERAALRARRYDLEAKKDALEAEKGALCAQIENVHTQIGDVCTEIFAPLNGMDVLEDKLNALRTEISELRTHFLDTVSVLHENPVKVQMPEKTVITGEFISYHPLSRNIIVNKTKHHKGGIVPPTIVLRGSDIKSLEIST